MKMFLLIGYELVTVLIPALILFQIMNRKNKKGLQKNQYPLSIFALLLFIAYLTGVFYVTGAGTIFDLIRYPFLINPSQLNLIPFSRNVDVVGYFLNILLFIPFGLLLPYAWPKTNSLKMIIPASFLFSLLIELSQLLNNRSTDVDDLLMNTLGGIIGYFFFKLFFSFFWKKRAASTFSITEPACYIIFMFLSRFFLFNEWPFIRFLYF